MDPFDPAQIPRFLRDRGFRLVQQPGDPLGAGNHPVVLQSDKLRLRFCKDGGIKEAQVASVDDPERWWSIPEVLNAIGRPGTNRSPELDVLVASVRDQLPPGFQAMIAQVHQNRQRAEDHRVEQGSVRAPILTSSQDISPAVPLVNGVPLNNAAMDPEPGRNLRPLVRVVLWILALIVAYLLIRR